MTMKKMDEAKDRVFTIPSSSDVVRDDLSG